MVYKVNDVANWFLAWTEDDPESLITLLKLQKLLYYSQAHHLAVYGTPLFTEPIEAWEKGPVVRDIYYRFHDDSQQGRKNKKVLPLQLDETEEFDFSIFTEEDNQFLIEIWETYGQFDAEKLVEMTHQETPWIEYYYTPNLRGVRNNEVIPLKALAKFFRAKETTA